MNLDIFVYNNLRSIGECATRLFLLEMEKYLIHFVQDLRYLRQLLK